METVLVLAVAVGVSALRGIVSFTAALTAAAPIAAQAVRLNVSRAPGRPYVDLGGVKILPREGLHLRLEIEEGSKRVVAVGLDYAPDIVVLNHHRRRVAR